MERCGRGARAPRPPHLPHRPARPSRRRQGPCIDGKLKQLGCLDDAAAQGCANVNAPMTNVGEPALTPNGRFMYVPARDSDTVNVFERDTNTGALTERGCVSLNAAPGCTTRGGLAARGRDGRRGEPERRQPLRRRWPGGRRCRRRHRGLHDPGQRHPGVRAVLQHQRDDGLRAGSGVHQSRDGGGGARRQVRLRRQHRAERPGRRHDLQAEHGHRPAQPGRPQRGREVHAACRGRRLRGEPAAQQSARHRGHARRQAGADHERGCGQRRLQRERLLPAPRLRPCGS